MTMQAALHLPPWRNRKHLVVLGICMIGTTGALGGDLLVSSRFTNNILRYDATTGAFKGVFAAGNGLANPNGIAYGPDGHLYAGLGDEPRVLRFHGQTGVYMDEFVGPTTPGGLVNCRDIAFGPDGNLFVADADNHRVQKLTAEGQLLAAWGMSGTGVADLIRDVRLSAEEPVDVVVR